MMEQKYKSILNNIPGGIALYRIGNTLETLMFTDGIPKMQGFSREEYEKAVAADALNVVYDADRPLLTQMMRHAVTHREELHVSYRVYCKDGSTIWVNLSAYPVEGGEDGLPVYQAIFSNTTTQFGLYQNICDNSTTGITVFDKQTSEVYYANRMMFTLTGCPEKPYVGALAAELFGNMVSAEEIPLLTAGDSVLTHKMENNGNILQIHTREITWLNHDSILLYAADVTSEHQKQNELQKRYEDQVSYSRMLSATAVASSMVNLTKNCITLQDTENSDIMTVITRQTPQEGFDAMYPHFPDEKIRKQYEKMFNTAAIIADFEKGITHKSIRHPYDSMNCWMESSYDAVRNPRSGDLEVYCFAKDVTEDEIRSDVIHLLMTQDYEDVILIHPQTGEPRILVNRGESAVFSEQKSSGDFSKGLENYFLKYSADADAKGMAYAAGLEAVTKALEKEKVYAISYSVYDAHGKIIRKRASYSYLNPYKTLILCTVQDITASFENEGKQREELQKALSETHRAMQAKTEFLSRMSHDIRTPLNVIMGMSHLAGENDNPADTNDCLHKINISSEFLLGLVNDVLDVERIESGKTELHLAPYSGKEFSEYIAAVIEPLCAQKNICFQYDYNGSNDFVIMQDKLRINQIYFNLLSNAVKFTPEGGKIHFHTDITRTEKTILLDVTISDTGIGMRKEFMEHMYEPFTQENQKITPTRIGTGLGLSIVKQMCDLMQMTISAESEPGEGTVFTLHGEYAVAEQPATAQPQTGAAEQLPSLSLKNRTVLVCEDHPLNQEIIRRLLEKEGTIVVMADDGKRGVEEFKRSAPGYFSAILMDIRMPVLDGYEATKVIRSLDRSDAENIPIIALSANAYEEDIQLCLEAGMNAHIAKPIKPEQLYQVLRQSIRKN